MGESCGPHPLLTACARRTPMQALTDWCTLRRRGCRCYAENTPSVLSQGGTHGARQGCHNGGTAARWGFNAGIPGWPQWWPGCIRWVGGSLAGKALALALLWYARWLGAACSGWLAGCWPLARRNALHRTAHCPACTVQSLSLAVAAAAARCSPRCRIRGLQTRHTAPTFNPFIYRQNGVC